MLIFILSTIVFFVAGFFINRYLDEQGLDRRMLRGLLVFMLASLISYGVSAAAGWIGGEADGGAPAAVAANKGAAGEAAALLNALRPLPRQR
ncbi:MAG TPA: hypothetical protein DEP05_04520 [Betaproteobacteria bacterium]|nr:hypothetical protein [Betaproteobacteria bacterium]